jgi:phosphatidylcholine synthase
VAFGWLGLALFIDGVDGTLARRAKVLHWLPRFSGDRLDLIVDYLTYVFVPVLALLRADFLLGAWGMVLGALILLSSLFHFCDTGSKAADHSFVGFPAIWNLVAFHVFAFNLPAWATAVLVVACVALTFVPLAWVHPMRTVRMRPLTIAASAAWGLAAATVLWSGFPAGPWAGAVLLMAVAYSVGLTAYGSRAR